MPHGHDHGHEHEHHRSHAHDHSHNHVHAPASYGAAFAIGIVLNTVFIAIEVIAGFFANSTALLSDAGHNASDVLGLVAAWAAYALSRRPPSARYTYGLKNSSILAALFNALLLLVAVGAIVFEAVHRLIVPEASAGPVMIAVAAVGIVINGFTAWLFARGRDNDLNISGAYLHMLADAAVSFGVVLAGLVILQTGWQWVDPAVSIIIAALIFWGTWSLLRESLAMSLSAAPRKVNPASIREQLLSLPGVQSVHDLHVWPIGTADTAMTVHLLMPAGHPGDGFLTRLCDDMQLRFAISHVTVQIETDPETRCALAPDDVV